MKKTYKFRLYPKAIPEKRLYTTLNRCRELYNAALSERKDAYKLHERHIVYQAENGQCVAVLMEASMKVRAVHYFEQKRALVEIKEVREEYKDIASHVLQDVLTHLDKAFANFFRRLANGDKPGYPRFQGRDRYDSFTYPDGAGWKLTTTEAMNAKGQKTFKGTLHLSKIGALKVKMHRELVGTIKTVTIKREVDQWYVTFSCEVPESEKLPVSYEDVGIDLGVSHLATLSNGEMIEHPRYYRKAKKVLEKRQQALSRKKRGSHRRAKAKKLLGRAHKKIANQRRDFLHKAARQLVNRYQMLVFEDIQVRKLVHKPKAKQDEQTAEYLPNGAAAKGGLNKSILDAGWGMFVAMCSCKAAWAGRTLLKVNPKYTSQICSGCGTVRKKDLSERWYSCDCGAELDRDVNAAINILRLGTSQLGNQ